MTDSVILLPVSLTTDEQSRVPPEFRGAQYFAASFSYPFYAVKYFFEQHLWKTCIIELILFIAFVVVFFFLVILNAILDVKEPKVGHVIDFLAVPYLLAFFVLIVVGSDSFRRLSDRTERLMSGEEEIALGEFGPAKDCSLFILRNFLLSLVELLVLVVGCLILLVPMILPIIGQILMICLLALVLGYFGLSRIYLSKGHYSDVFPFISTHFVLVLGFGLACVLLSLIPLVNLFMPFVLPVAATRIWLHVTYMESSRQEAIHRVVGGDHGIYDQIDSVSVTTTVTKRTTTTTTTTTTNVDDVADTVPVADYQGYQYEQVQSPMMGGRGLSLAGAVKVIPEG